MQLRKETVFLLTSALCARDHTERLDKKRKIKIERQLKRKPSTTEHHTHFKN